MDKPLTILLIEDEALIALDLKIGLERAGYVVDKVLATGEQAVEHMEQASPDVILMDIRLAGAMTGIDAARQIRRQHRIPIIFMTGFARDMHDQHLDELQPSILVNKPVSVFILKQAISQFC
jgi:CheY-like chemotaxis protein